MLNYKKYCKTRSPKQIIVMVHGYGSNKDNLISLASDFSEYVPEALFVSPDAPNALENFYQSFGLRQWFSLVDRSELKMIDGLRAASVVLEEFVKKLLVEHDIPEKQFAFIGFSQGAMLSLHLGLRMVPSVGGVLAYSGSLIAPYLLAKEMKSKPEVVLVHGAEDAIVEISAMDQAKRALDDYGVSVQANRCENLAHTISPAGIGIGGEFLRRVLISK